MTAIASPALSPSSSLLSSSAPFKSPSIGQPVSVDLREKTVIVSLSAAGAAALSPSAKAVDALLTDQGEAIFDNALGGLRQFRSNLATVLDDSKASQAEKNAANEAMQAREQLAFGRFAATSTLDYARAYIEYYDSLSPEEQNSDRYRGTRENMVAVANQASGATGEDVGDLSKSQDPIAMLFEKLKQNAFKLTEANLDSFIDDYRVQVGNLVNADEQAETVSVVIDRLRLVQGTVEAARGGDSGALRELNALATAG